jgi:hypothetical protein
VERAPLITAAPLAVGAEVSGYDATASRPLSAASDKVRTPAVRKPRGDTLPV